MDLHCGKDAFEKSVLRKNEITIRPMLAIQRPRSAAANAAVRTLCVVKLKR
jgi:hypothetical protein